jgi:hypothetical protein
MSPGLGIGVTAPTEAEGREWAEAIREQYFPGSTILGMVADVDVSTLDEHVLPNSGPSAVRGVWYPRLNI